MPPHQSRKVKESIPPSTYALIKLISISEAISSTPALVAVIQSVKNNFFVLQTGLLKWQSRSQVLWPVKILSVRRRGSPSNPTKGEIVNISWQMCSAKKCCMLEKLQMSSISEPRRRQRESKKMRWWYWIVAFKTWRF